jgi:hypothetical protein
VKRVVVVCAALLCAQREIHAQSAIVVAGNVYEDRAALAGRTAFVAAEGVSVKLYRDDGDATPTVGDAAIANDRTDRDGFYSFNVTPGTYWVVVDSRTFRTAGAWPEQTFGPAGSLCTNPDGGTNATYFEGPCFGGRTQRSDDASSIATAEHLALVNVRDSATRVDFGFSYEAVTSTADGASIQGSFRQFLENANAVAGPNRMRFVPLERPREQRQTTFGVPPRWWIIALTTALPELRDADTVIDGTAYNFLSPASIANVHGGRFGESATLRPEDRISRLQKPELELTLTGATGVVCEARCGIRAIAMHGAQTAVITRADARLDHVLIGAAADGEPALRGTIGLQADRGVVAAHHLLVTSQSTAGVLVRNGARIDGDHLEISRCGEPATGGGIVLLSDGSSVRSSTIAANAGAGIVIGSLDGSSPASGNTIDGSTISGNQAGVVLGPAATRNVITRNDLMWNRLGGITAAPFDTAAKAPRENRFSANRFDENGLRPIILTHAVDDPNELARASATCAPDAASANGGITPPQITNVRVADDNGALRIVIRGRACPGQVVELYQSYVTSGVREQQQSELPRVRKEATERESMTTQQREITLPSIGEFNYLGATNTNAEGAFEAMFPLPTLAPLRSSQNSAIEETNVWARQVLPGADPSDRAFSAIAIDAVGNTSEMSVRRQVD